MSKEKEEVTKEPSKFDKLKEMWKDKRGRAKIKLCLYLIFFVGVVIFARVLGYQNSKLPHNDNVNNNSFIYTLKDNYEYDINIEKDNNKYNYHGRKLGLNESIKVKDDNKFKLKGCDLYTDLLLTPWEAALGTRAIVQSIDDETKVYIPQGIQSGEKIRIPNKGYQSSKTTRGDLVAEIKIVVPKQLTQQEEKIFKKLNEISNFNPRK